MTEVLSQRAIDEIHDHARHLEDMLDQALADAPIWTDIADDGTTTVWEQDPAAIAAADRAARRFEKFLQTHRDVLSAEPRWRDYFAIQADSLDGALCPADAGTIPEKPRAVSIWDVSPIWLSARWPNVIIVGHLSSPARHPAPATRFPAFSGIGPALVEESGRTPFVLVAVRWAIPPTRREPSRRSQRTALATGIGPAMLNDTWYLRRAVYDSGAQTWRLPQVTVAAGPDTAHLSDTFRDWARGTCGLQVPARPITIFDSQ